MQTSLMPRKNVGNMPYLTLAGSSSPCGESNLNSDPSAAVSESVSGLKSSFPAKTRAVTICNVVTTITKSSQKKKKKKHSSCLFTLHYSFCTLLQRNVALHLHY